MDAGPEQARFRLDPTHDTQEAFAGRLIIEPGVKVATAPAGAPPPQSCPETGDLPLPRPVGFPRADGNMRR